MNFNSKLDEKRKKKNTNWPEWNTKLMLTQREQIWSNLYNFFFNATFDCFVPLGFACIYPLFISPIVHIYFFYSLNSLIAG